MPPSPEKAEQQPRGQGEAAPANETALGLRLEAHVKSPTWEVGVPAVIQDFAQGEVTLLLADPITERTPVNVQVNNCSFDGEILFCQTAGSLWEAHVSFDDVDATGLRRTPRFPVHILARIFTDVNEIPIQGTIVDVSGDGLGIELPQTVPVKTRVAVQSEQSTALGEVRHCRELRSGRFRAGVYLHHIIRQDPELAKAAAESGWMGKLARRFRMGD